MPTTSEDEFVVLSDDELVVVKEGSYPSMEELAKMQAEYPPIRPAFFSDPHTADAMRFAFCLVEGIVLQNYVSVLGALGHLAIVVSRQCGFDPPRIMHNMVTYAVYAYRNSAIMHRVATHLGSKRYDDAAIAFASHTETLIHFASRSRWPRRLQLLYSAYRGLSVLSDPKRLLSWFLRELRAELIRQRLYSTV